MALIVGRRAGPSTLAGQACSSSWGRGAALGASAGRRPAPGSSMAVPKAMLAQSPQPGPGSQSAHATVHEGCQEAFRVRVSLKGRHLRAQLRHVRLSSQALLWRTQKWSARHPHLGSPLALLFSELIHGWGLRCPVALHPAPRAHFHRHRNVLKPPEACSLPGHGHAELVWDGGTLCCCWEQMQAGAQRGVSPTGGSGHPGRVQVGRGWGAGGFSVDDNGSSVKRGVLL